MKLTESTRRAFLSNSFKGAMIVSAGATFAGSLLNPLLSLGQTAPAAL